MSQPSEARAAAGHRRELQIRTVSGLVLAVGAVVLNWLGTLPLAILLFGAAALVVMEWTAMVRPTHRRLVRGVGAGALALAMGLIAAGLPGWSVIAWLAGTALTAGLGTRYGEGARAAMWVGLGPLYAGCGLLSLLALRAGPGGALAVLFVFVVAWVTDIGAYFVGRQLKGPRLWPAVSPGKTWSGAIGGAGCGAVAGALVAWLAGEPRLPGVILVALLLAVATELGDLLESAAKRRFKIKDAGSLIPGHGGVMDRVDGLMAASAIAFLVGVLSGGAGAAAPAAGLLGLVAQ